VERVRQLVFALVPPQSGKLRLQIFDKLARLSAAVAQGRPGDMDHPLRRRSNTERLERLRFVNHQCIIARRSGDKLQRPNVALEIAAIVRGLPVPAGRLRA
jgi:hypothetical protein